MPFVSPADEHIGLCRSADSPKQATSYLLSGLGLPVHTAVQIRHGGLCFRTYGWQETGGICDEEYLSSRVGRFSP